MAEQTIEVEIMRDVWVGEPGAAQRLRKGERLTVPLDNAVLDGIEAGAVRRVKPGEPEKAKGKK